MTGTTPPSSLPTPLVIAIIAFLALVLLAWVVALIQARQRRQSARRRRWQQSIDRYQGATVPEYFAHEPQPEVGEPEEVYNWAETGAFEPDSIYARVTDQARMFPRQDA